MRNRNLFRLGMKVLGLCTALGPAAGAAWAQTPSDAIFSHQYNHTTAYTWYMDFDVLSNIGGQGPLAWNWPTTPSRYTLFQDLEYWETSNIGVCTDIWVGQQGATPAPDWSLWIQLGSTTFQKISDNHNGTVMPRMRLWSKNSGALATGIRLSAGVDANSPASHGAAWVHSDRKYISKSSCFSGSLPLVSVENSVITVVRTGP